MAKEKRGLPFWRYEERIPTDDFEEIIYEKDGPIGRLILNTPEKRNPLSYDRIIELSMGLQAMEMDDDIRVIIIKGAGPAFCSGYDLTPGTARDNNPNPDDPRASLGYANVGDSGVTKFQVWHERADGGFAGRYGQRVPPGGDLGAVGAVQAG